MDNSTNIGITTNPQSVINKDLSKKEDAEKIIEKYIHEREAYDVGIMLPFTLSDQELYNALEVATEVQDDPSHEQNVKEFFQKLQDALAPFKGNDEFKKVFDSYDTDGNGSLVDEVKAAFTKKTDPPISKKEDAEKIIEKYIHEREAYALGIMLPFTVSSQELYNALEVATEVQDDPSHERNVKEFFQKLQDDLAPFKGKPDEIKKVFDSFDTDGNGSLVDEVKAAFTSESEFDNNNKIIEDYANYLFQHGVDHNPELKAKALKALGDNYYNLHGNHGDVFLAEKRFNDMVVAGILDVSHRSDLNDMTDEEKQNTVELFTRSMSKIYTWGANGAHGGPPP